MLESSRRCYPGDQLFVGSKDEELVKIRLVKVTGSNTVVIEFTFPVSWQRLPIRNWVAATGHFLEIGPPEQSDQIIISISTIGSDDADIGISHPDDHELHHQQKQLEKAS